MILHQDYLYHARPSLLKTAWKVQTASKLAGDSQATHYVTVQAVQSTYLSLDQPDTKMTKDLWLLAQSALDKYTLHSTRHFVEVEPIKMELLYSI